MRSERLYMADNPYQPPQPGYVTATDDAGEQGHGLGQSDPAESQILRQRAKNGSGWFFWIAALSLINSVILHNGGQMFFVVGLGITAVADQMALLFIQENPGLESVIHWGAIGFAAVVALIVAGFGWLARKGWLSIYAIGMLLYLLDGLLFMLFNDWMSAGFHAFALFWMWNGFAASRKLRAAETAY